MRNLHLKLIAVFNSFDLKLYEANNIKIIGSIKIKRLPFHKHSRHEKHEGLYQKRSSPGSEFDPHTSPEDLEHHDAAKLISDYLEKILEKQCKYKELIVIGEHKTLGCFRQIIGHNVKQIMTKSIAKNLVHQELKYIEHAVFENS